MVRRDELALRIEVHALLALAADLRRAAGGEPASSSIVAASARRVRRDRG